MATEAVTTRVHRLEEMMYELQRITAQTASRVDAMSRKVEETTESVNRLSREMRAAEAQAAQDRREAQEYRRERDARWEREREEAAQRKQELEERWERQRQETEAYRRERDARWERERKQFRREMADITRSIGRLVEDLVAPSIPNVLAQVIGCEELPRMEGVRNIRRLNGRTQEYDVLAICGDYLLITEVKTYLRSEYVTDFIAKLSVAREFLSEYSEKQFIGALATFYVDPSLVSYGERNGLIMLGVVDGLIQVLNETAFTPRVW